MTEVAGVHRSATLVDLDRRYLADAAKIRFFPFTPVAGSGSRIVDADGRSWLDFTAGWAVSNAGYGDPAVADAVHAHLSRGTYAGVVSAVIESAVNLAQRLVELAPVRGAPKVWFGHSGSDANEALARLLRIATGRPRILTFKGAYHGSTDGSAALSGHTAQARYAGESSQAAKLPYPDAYRPVFAAEPGENERGALRAIEDALATTSPAAETAAILIEPIQSDGGILAPSSGFMQGIEAICRRHGILLAIDEVKVGMGRTGDWLAHSSSGVTPDLIVLGKALGGGLPLSAVVGPAEVLDTGPAMALFTTAGNALSCAAAMASIRSLEERGLLAHAGRVGEHLAAGLRALAKRHELIGDVRGRGLILGVELVEDRSTKEPAVRATSKVCYRAAELGLAVFFVGMSSNVIEITPPLCLTTAEADEGLAILDQALIDVVNGQVPDEAVASYAGW
jgi:4-aminobutyrate aminotransferase